MEVEYQILGDEFSHFLAEAWLKISRVGLVPVVRVGPRQGRERGRRPARAIIRRPFQRIQVPEEAQALAQGLDDADEEELICERRGRGRDRRVPRHDVLRAERPAVADNEAELYIFRIVAVPVWKSTRASGAPDNSSLSHFSAMMWP